MVDLCKIENCWLYLDFWTIFSIYFNIRSIFEILFKILQHLWIFLKKIGLSGFVDFIKKYFSKIFFGLFLPYYPMFDWVKNDVTHQNIGPGHRRSCYVCPSVCPHSIGRIFWPILTKFHMDVGVGSELFFNSWTPYC